MAYVGTTPVLRQLKRATLPRDGGGLADGQLLDAFVASRDEAAFEALVCRHGPMVLGVCRRILRRQHDAEDAFQATFLVLARRAASVMPRGAVANWLYGVAYRIALAARTAAARRAIKEKEAARMSRSDRVDAEQTGDLRTILDEELSRLPDKYRTALVLCELGGRTGRDAARHLRIPEGTLSSRLTTARRMLARRLVRRGVILPAAGLGIGLGGQSLSAAVPRILLRTTVQAATGAAGGAVSPTVVSLVDGALRSLLMNKLKRPVVLVLGGLMLASGLLGLRSAASEKSFRLPPRAGAAASLLPAEQAIQPKDIELAGPVDSVAWSPDGRLIALKHRAKEEADGRFTGAAIKLCDPATGQITRTLLEAERKTESLAVAFSPDGKWVAAALHKFEARPFVVEVKLWDARTGAEMPPLSGAEHRLHAIAFSPDGKRLAAGSAVITPLGETTGGEVLVWDVDSRALVWRKQEHTNQVNGVAFSPDGKLVASAGSDKVVKLLDANTGEPKATLSEHGDQGVFSVAFSPDGKHLATGGLDGSVRIWDVANASLSRTLPGWSAGRILVAAFTPDGKRLVAGGTGLDDKGSVQIVTLPDGEPKPVAAEPIAFPRALALSPDGKTVAIGSWDRKVKLIPLK